jgi:hypothetical protein
MSCSAAADDDDDNVIQIPCISIFKLHRVGEEWTEDVVGTCVWLLLKISQQLE